MFKDEIKKITLPQIEIPKIKGHTKIELTDVHTGKKEVIEHDNAITDGLQSFLSSLGIGANTNFRLNTWRDRELWKVILGGIYLFDTALPSNAKYMPDGTQMVANGYFNGANGGNPSELGTYNANESFSDDNTINIVYDWLTSQGNGTISAVSLGTVMGGRMGYGNATSKTALSSASLSENQQVYTGAIGLSNASYICAIDGDNVYAITTDNVAVSATEISVLHYKIIDVNKCDVFRKASSTSYPISPKETIAISLPSGRGSRCYFHYYADYKAKKVYMMTNNQIAPNATLTWYDIDIETATVTTRTFVNNTGETINNAAGTDFFVIDDTYALVVTTSGKIYKVNHQNSTVIGETERNGQTFAGNYVYKLNKITDSLYSGLNSNNFIYSLSKNAFYPCNSSFSNLAAGSTYYDVDTDTMRVVGANDITFFQNPLRLMTINNLDTPVEKTAAKTMKVTYTITRASS